VLVCPAVEGCGQCCRLRAACGQAEQVRNILIIKQRNHPARFAAIIVNKRLGL
jgi:hypothetical protein